MINKVLGDYTRNVLRMIAHGKITLDGSILRCICACLIVLCWITIRDPARLAMR
jgi:hypothetical protein